MDAGRVLGNGWIELIDPKGRTYYHNQKSGETRWEKPIELQTREELLRTRIPWREQADAESGRNYYYHITTKETTWDEPADHKALREARQRAGITQADVDAVIKADQAIAAAAAASVTPSLVAGNAPTSAAVSSTGPSAPASTSIVSSSPALTSTDPNQPPLVATIDSAEDAQYRDQQQRLDVFKQMLHDYQVTSTWTWDMTMRAIINDPRYTALKSLPEKRKALQDYQNEKRAHEREEKRKREQRSRDAFIQMLRECTELKSRVPWLRAQAYFEGDHRNLAIPPREREELYFEYLKELEQTERERARETRRKNLESFRRMLEDEKNQITINSQWRKVREQFKDDPVMQALTNHDQLNVFQDYIKDLERFDDEKRRHDAQMQKHQSRKAREEFRQLLQQHYEGNTLGRETKWKDFLSRIQEDPRYQAMTSSTQTGSLASELFGDYVETLWEDFAREKLIVKEVVEDTQFDPTRTYTQDEFVKMLHTAGRSAIIHARDYNDLFEYFKDKANKALQQWKKEEEHIKRKIEKKFWNVLRDSRAITSSTTWDQVKEKFASVAPELTENEKLNVFKEYLAKQADDESEEEEGSIREDANTKDKKDKKHKKDKKSKRDRSPSPSEKKRKRSVSPSERDGKKRRE